MTVDVKLLAEKAKEAQKNAYCPYSNFAVGSAILADDGNIYAGCNVETAHYKGVCAEASAISAMITAGAKKIRVAVVIGPKEDMLLTPCGDCRQRLAEFSNADTKILVMGSVEKVLREYKITDLLPDAFTADVL